MLSLGLAAILLGIAGYFIAGLVLPRTQASFDYRLPDPDPREVKAVAANAEYTCRAVAEATVAENRLPAEGPAGKAFAGAASDELSLKIGADGNSMLLRTAAGVKAGIAAATEYPIVQRNDDYIIGMYRGPMLDTSALALNVHTLKAIWSYTGLGTLGLSGHSLLLTCR
jgi:hypothetical protein